MEGELGVRTRSWLAGPSAWSRPRRRAAAASCSCRCAATSPRRASTPARECAVCVDRTWTTSIYDDNGHFAFYAAREPEVAAELVVALTLVGALFATTPDTQSVDIATTPDTQSVDIPILLSAAPSNRRVSSERAVSGGRFGEPAGYLHDPVEDVPTYHIDSRRFDLADVQAAYPVAEELLGPWLMRFRSDDRFQRLRER